MNLDLSEYTISQIKKIIFNNEDQFLGEKWKFLGSFFVQFYFQITSKVQRFYKFWWLYQKNHINIYQNVSNFYFKKNLNLIKRGIISGKTSYICSCNDFRLTYMNNLHCNLCIYVSFYAANMLTSLIYW